VDNTNTSTSTTNETDAKTASSSNQEIEEIERFVCLFIDFLQQDGIEDAIKELINDIPSIFNNIDVNNVDDDALIAKIVSVLVANDKYKCIIEHDFYNNYFDKKFVPLLIKKKTWLPFILTKVTMMKPIVEQILPQILKVIPSVLSGVLDVIQNYEEKSKLNWNILHSHIHQEVRRNIMPLIFQTMGNMNGNGSGLNGLFRGFGGRRGGRGRCGRFGGRGRGRFGRGFCPAFATPCNDDNTADTTCQSESKSQTQEAKQEHVSHEKLSWIDRAGRNAVCDECKEDIKQVRYICLTCDDYDLCASCEAKDVHNVNHPLMKVKVPFGPVHFHVECDECHMKPIIGTRYKCGICDNYDICQGCYDKHVHDHHPLLKMKVPNGQTNRPYNGRLPTDTIEYGQQFSGRRCGPCPVAGGFVPFRRGGMGFHKGKKVFKKVMKELFKSTLRPEYVSNTNLEVPDVPKFETEDSINDDNGSKRHLKVKYVKDLTIPKDVIVSPNQILVKTWLVENKKKGWPEGTKLIFLRGDREVSVHEEYEVPLAKGGKEQIELSAVIITPNKPGKYTAYYTLADENRVPFGPRLWTNFEVQIVDDDDLPSENKQDLITDTPPTTTTANNNDDNDSKLPVAEPVVSENKTERKVPLEIPNSYTDLAKSMTLDDKVEKYAQQLALLDKMGFKSQQVNIALLDVYQGNIAKVLDELFNNQ
jgi:hypothetical protein